MGWTTDVAKGAAQDLAGAGLGIWRETGIYTANETGIVVKVMPATPDRVISLTVYPVQQAGAASDVLLGIQVRCRGTKDPRNVDDLADAIFDLWHGARGRTFGPALLTHLWRQSHAILGADANGRHETTSNFYARTAHASTHAAD